MKRWKLIQKRWLHKIALRFFENPRKFLNCLNVQNKNWVSCVVCHNWKSNQEFRCIWFLQFEFIHETANSVIYKYVENEIGKFQKCKSKEIKNKEQNGGK